VDRFTTSKEGYSLPAPRSICFSNAALSPRPWSEEVLLVFVRFLAFAAVSLALAAPALAVTGGTVDGTAHPAVGLLLADRGKGPQPDCSGSLVSSTVFLTAAHCVADLTSNRVWVTFDSVYTASSKLLPGTASFDPQFGHDHGDLHDLAVVVLDRPVAGIAPLSLARAGTLDAGKPASVVVVGYGADQAGNGNGNAGFSYDFTRRYATATVDSVTKSELHYSSHDGGTCYGDSGGPELLGSAIVAVTSHGDTQCAGQSRGYRVDTPGARAFLSQFVRLP
jgi:V8-like Glu-specific endopeptidase